MGIGINVGTNQNYSYLFGGSGSGNLNFLSDYMAIKNGSYAKLMKSYYGSVNSSSTTASGSRTGTSNYLDRILEEKRNPKVSKETQEANSKLSSGMSSLMSTVSTLQNSNTYTASEDGTSAADKVVSAVKKYVSQYNDVVSTAKNSTLTNKTAHVAGVMRSSEANAKKLAEIGVSINSDGTLFLDESKLKSTDISKVQELFSKDNIISYGSTVMSRLGFASASPDPVDSAEKDKAEQDNATYVGAAALKTDIEKLISGSLYKKDDSGKYDVDKLFAAAKSFVGNYNKMLDAAGSNYNSGVTANLAQILEKTARYKNELKQFGISVDAKGKLKIDEDTFKKSDMSQLQKFFNEYGSSIATNVSLVNYYMTTQAGAANGYTADGTYYVQGNSHYSFDI